MRYDELAFREPRTVNVREVLNAIFYLLWTGCQWKALPKDLPPRSTVWEYLDMWDWDGTLGRIVERTLAWISRCRRLARDYERHARKAAAFVRLAMIRLMLRRLGPSR